MSGPLKVLCVGAGHMGRPHALAYHRIPGFEIVGIVTRSPGSRKALNAELGGGYAEFASYAQALEATRPDVVSISTYTETHRDYALAAIAAGAHVFIEKPLAETVAEAEEVVAAAAAARRKLVVGYILRHHPGWVKFIRMARELGKPLVMRMNLNQQSSGDKWVTHKNLMASCPPIVDCGVHYVDVMCQMTGARPVRVSGIRARLSDDLPETMANYGHLQVVFDDGSVGWYEAGWGPMMSESAHFVKDVVGPMGSVSIETRRPDGDSAKVDRHPATDALRLHSGTLGPDGNFEREDSWLAMEDVPDHDALCRREQEFLLRAIREDLDLTEHLEGALNSLRIVLAAAESAQTGRTIDL